MFVALSSTYTIQHDIRAGNLGPPLMLPPPSPPGRVLISKGWPPIYIFSLLLSSSFFVVLASSYSSKSTYLWLSPRDSCYPEASSSEPSSSVRCSPLVVLYEKQPSCRPLREDLDHDTTTAPHSDSRSPSWINVANHGLLCHHTTKTV